MPFGMVVGALLCRPVTAVEAWSHHMITPSLIFLMLFSPSAGSAPATCGRACSMPGCCSSRSRPAWGYTCCSGRSIRWWRRGHDLRAGPHRHGGGGHRRHAGADVALMATYSLVCNLVIALVAPVVLSFAGSGVCTPTQILARIAPLLIMPFARRRRAASWCPASRGGSARTASFRSGCGSCRWSWSSDAPRRSSSTCGGRISVPRSPWPPWRSCSAWCSSRRAACWAAATAIRWPEGSRWPEKYGPRRVDGPVVPQSRILDRTHGLHRLAELREFLPDLPQATASGFKTMYSQVKVNYELRREKYYIISPSP